MTVEKAIDNIIKEQGIEILNFPDRFQGLVMDYVGAQIREVQLFCLACQKGLLRYAIQLVSLTDRDASQEVALKAKAMLQNDAFMSEENAACCMNMLLNGLGFKFEIITDISGKNYKDKRERIIFSKKPDFATYDACISTGYTVRINSDMIQDLRKASHNGDVRALLCLGDCYYHGIGVTEDWVIAETYYRKALELGNKKEKMEANRRLNEIYNKNHWWL